MRIEVFQSSYRVETVDYSHFTGVVIGRSGELLGSRLHSVDSIFKVDSDG